MINLDKVHITLDLEDNSDPTLHVEIEFQSSMYFYRMTFWRDEVSWFVGHSEDGEMESFNMSYYNDEVKKNAENNIFELPHLLTMIENCFAKSAYVRLEQYT